MELMFVVLIGGILVAASIVGYNTLYVPQQAEADIKRAGFVIGGVERVKNNVNRGAYLTQATATSIGSIQTLKDMMGGDVGATTVAGWTYQCPNGVNKTLTIVTDTYTDAAKQRQVVNGINAQHAPWRASLDGNKIRIVNTPVTCAPLP